MGKIQFASLSSFLLDSPRLALERGMLEGKIDLHKLVLGPDSGVNTGVGNYLGWRTT